MAKAREWSEEEIDKLNRLYTSNQTFEEINKQFPSRTSNAIRLKASRLGIRRPTISTSLIKAENLLQCIDKNNIATGYLFKCKECGIWNQIDGLDNNPINIISCNDCGSIYKIIK